MVTTSEFQEIILNNKDKLTKIDFKTKVKDGSEYKFIIDKILKSSLDIIIFIRYEDMIIDSRWEEIGLPVLMNPIEFELKQLISPDAKTEFDLKMDTKVKKPKLFKKLIQVEIEESIYKFKITGAGEHAIKLSLRITFEDINLKDDPKQNPLENKLKNIIYFISTDRQKTWDMDLFQIVSLLN